MAEQTRLAPLLRRLGGVIAAVALTGAALAAAPSAVAAPVVHYVDCSKKMNGDGSAAAPWNSVAAVNHHGAFLAGEQILLKRGTTCAGQLKPAGSGAQGAPIVLGAYGSGARPTVAGGGTYTLTGAVQLVNQSWWTIQDLHVTNAAPKAKTTKTYRSGVLLMSNNGGGLSGLTVQRVAVDSVLSNPGLGNTRAYGGISALTFGTSVKSGFTGLVIRDNQVTDVGRSGIVVSNAQYPKSWDTAPRIAGNSVRHVRGDGIVLIGAKHGRIDHNRVAYAADLKSCPGCGRQGGPSTASAGIWPSNTQDAVIEHNEVYGTYKYGGDGEGFDIDRSAVRTILQNNYAHDNQGGGVLLCGASDSIIRFNVFQNNGMSALAFYGKSPSKNTSFINNTVYAKRSVGAKVVRTFGAFKGSNVVFRNNLIYSYGPGQYQWPTKSVHTAANTLIGTPGAARPHDARTSYANPGLKSPGSGKVGFSSLKGYQPKHAKSFPRGVAIWKSVKTDFFGKAINPAKPPRGAAG